MVMSCHHSRPWLRPDNLDMYFLALGTHFREIVKSEVKRYFKDSSKGVFCSLALSTLGMIELG